MASFSLSESNFQAAIDCAEPPAKHQAATKAEPDVSLNTSYLRVRVVEQGRIGFYFQRDPSHQAKADQTSPSPTTSIEEAEAKVKGEEEEELSEQSQLGTIPIYPEHPVPTTVASQATTSPSTISAATRSPHRQTDRERAVNFMPRPCSRVYGASRVSRRSHPRAAGVMERRMHVIAPRFYFRDFFPAPRVEGGRRGGRPCVRFYRRNFFDLPRFI